MEPVGPATQGVPATPFPLHVGTQVPLCLHAGLRSSAVLVQGQEGVKAAPEHVEDPGAPEARPADLGRENGPGGPGLGGPARTGWMALGQGAGLRLPFHTMKGSPWLVTEVPSSPAGLGRGVRGDRAAPGTVREMINRCRLARCSQIHPHPPQTGRAQPRPSPGQPREERTRLPARAGPSDSPPHAKPGPWWGTHSPCPPSPPSSPA